MFDSTVADRRRREITDQPPPFLCKKPWPQRPPPLSPCNLPTYKPGPPKSSFEGGNERDPQKRGEQSSPPLRGTKPPFFPPPPMVSPEAGGGLCCCEGDEPLRAAAAATGGWPQSKATQRREPRSRRQAPPSAAMARRRRRLLRSPYGLFHSLAARSSVAGPLREGKTETKCKGGGGRRGWKVKSL